MEDREENCLIAPQYLSNEEKVLWDEIVEILQKSTSYKKTIADRELLIQYVQLKTMRDNAWRAWQENPEKYVRIVTGICSDGKTPKIVVKENEHYKILQDSNKQLEKILTDLRLTPKARKPKWM